MSEKNSEKGAQSEENAEVFDDRPFFDRDVKAVAKDLLGCILEHVVDGVRLSVRIIETEAYYGQGDRGSHASLGFTDKRKALFMDPGTIYMYYARGGDSLNFTCNGTVAKLLNQILMYWQGYV